MQQSPILFSEDVASTRLFFTSLVSSFFLFEAREKQLERESDKIKQRQLIYSNCVRVCGAKFSTLLHLTKRQQKDVPPRIPISIGAQFDPDGRTANVVAKIGEADGPQKRGDLKPTSGRRHLSIRTSGGDERRERKSNEQETNRLE